MTNGLIFNVQKCSIHDGTGIRTLVFLKGCQLKCLWCANPESQSFSLEISSNERLCIDCGACLTTCSSNCINHHEHTYPIGFSQCKQCLKCADVCYTSSKKIVGEHLSAEALLDIVRRDKAYYKRSNGGVTFSGREPFAQPKFLLEAAKLCKEEGISVTVETCGCGNYNAFSPVLDYVDQLFFDIKHINNDKHKQLTGRFNQHILRNLAKINQHDVNIIVRIPIIPSLNDDIENLEGIAKKVIRYRQVTAIELMAYHSLGSRKYELLGREYTISHIKSPTTKQMEDYVNSINHLLLPFGKHCKYEVPYNEKTY